MDYFPIFMDLRGQIVVVVGAGTVAERKVRLLLRAGAGVQVVARELNPRFLRWQSEGKVRHRASEYRAEVLRGARLVFAATSDAGLNQRVYEDAEAARIPVNVVDDPARCRFISPAVIDRSPVQVAISTGGESPVLARRIRGWIENLLPHGLGRVAREAGALRREVHERIPPAGRRRFWEGLLTDQKIRQWSLRTPMEIRGHLRSEIDRSAGSARRHPSAEGRVYLVGAGPGRADLLTLRALHVLGQADVVLHDSLVGEEVLDQIRRDAERIDVGKRAGAHKHSQEEIHRLLAEHARRGRSVVRLKGGDPFIFGRGGEELEHLQANGIAFEVVPGITAATGCAAFAGIPLTHRDHARALTFITGHYSAGGQADPDDSAGPVNWAGVAGPGRTAVVYMGVRKAAVIRRELIRAGVGRNLPVALVVDGTRDTQSVLHGTVGNLPQLAARADPSAPGLLIIGQVAALGVNLAWFNPQFALRPAA